MRSMVHVLVVDLDKKSCAHVLIASVEGWSELLYCHSFLYVERELILTPVDDLKREFRLCTWCWLLYCSPSVDVLSFFSTAHMCSQTQS